MNARVRRHLEVLEAIRPNYREFSEGDLLKILELAFENLVAADLDVL